MELKALKEHQRISQNCPNVKKKPQARESQRKFDSSNAQMNQKAQNGEKVKKSLVKEHQIISPNHIEHFKYIQVVSNNGSRLMNNEITNKLVAAQEMSSSLGPFFFVSSSSPEC